MKHPTKAARAKGHGFLQIPNQVLDSQNFLKLTPKACKLLLDIATQYRGLNNGDLQAAFTLMKKRGWHSKATLAQALAELLYYGFIGQARQGGKHLCSLFYLTWRNIDYLPMKNLHVSPTTCAPDDWKKVQILFKAARKLDVQKFSQTSSIGGKVGSKTGLMTKH
jgi:hypothetical protein